MFARVPSYNNIFLEGDYTGQTRGKISDHLLENNFVSQSPEMRKMRTYQDVAIKALITFAFFTLFGAVLGTAMIIVGSPWGVIPITLLAGIAFVALAVAIRSGTVYLKLRKQLPSETEITNLRNEINQSLDCHIKSLGDRIDFMHKSVAFYTGLRA